MASNDLSTVPDGFVVDMVFRWVVCSAFFAVNTWQFYRAHKLHHTRDPKQRGALWSRILSQICCTAFLVESIDPHGVYGVLSKSALSAILFFYSCSGWIGASLAILIYIDALQSIVAFKTRSSKGHTRVVSRSRAVRFSLGFSLTIVSLGMLYYVTMFQVIYETQDRGLFQIVATPYFCGGLFAIINLGVVWNVVAFKLSKHLKYARKAEERTTGVRFWARFFCCKKPANGTTKWVGAKSDMFCAWRRLTVGTLLFNICSAFVAYILILKIVSPKLQPDEGYPLCDTPAHCADAFAIMNAHPNVPAQIWLFMYPEEKALELVGLIEYSFYFWLVRLQIYIYICLCVCVCVCVWLGCVCVFSHHGSHLSLSLFHSRNYRTFRPLVPLCGPLLSITLLWVGKDTKRYTRGGVTVPGSVKSRMYLSGSTWSKRSGKRIYGAGKTTSQNEGKTTSQNEGKTGSPNSHGIENESKIPLPSMVDSNADYAYLEHEVRMHPVSSIMEPVWGSTPTMATEETKEAGQTGIQPTDTDAPSAQLDMRAKHIHVPGGVSKDFARSV
jgi:uncharacterized membrane protein